MVMETKPQKVNMEAQMEVTRVGEEVEAEMMTGATHVVTETAQTLADAEMVTSIEVVDVLAHDPDLQTDTTVLERGATATIERAASLERHATVAEAVARKAVKPAVTEPHH
jgi:hypothetical protein